jgi:hypothetical protein
MEGYAALLEVVDEPPNLSRASYGVWRFVIGRHPLDTIVRLHDSAQVVRR